MSRRGRLLLISGLVLAGLAIAVLLTGVDWVVAAAGLILVLLVPGVALQRALFPIARGSEAALLALGLGLGSVIFLGFVLNLLPGGLSAATWAISLVALSSVALAVGVYRRPKGAGWWTICMPEPRAALALALAAAIAGGAFVIARVGEDEHVRPGFTQLWMVPEDASWAVTVGIRSAERETETFSLVLDVDGERLSEWSPLVLGHNEEWMTRAPVPAPATGTTSRVQATLVRLGDPGTPYRRVHVWLTQ